MAKHPAYADVIAHVAGIGRDGSVAPAYLVCDASALATLPDVIDSARRALRGVSSWTWRVQPTPTKPEGRALKPPEFALQVHRRSSSSLDLLSSGIETTDDAWERIEGADFETVGSVVVPSGIVCVAPLDPVALDLANELPSFAGDSVAVGDLGMHGALVRLDPGTYSIAYARAVLDVETDAMLELYRLRRER